MYRSTLSGVFSSTSFVAMGRVIVHDFRFIRWFYCAIGFFHINICACILFSLYTLRLYASQLKQSYKSANFFYFARVITFFKWWFGFAQPKSFYYLPLTVIPWRNSRKFSKIRRFCNVNYICFFALPSLFT